MEEGVSKGSPCLEVLFSKQCQAIQDRQALGLDMLWPEKNVCKWELASRREEF